MVKKFTEKHISAFLIFLGVAALLLGVKAIRSTIRAPFLRPYSSNSNSSTSLSLETELKSKDTDKDGLSDYDELNIHQTSPYLEDSDSDGITDQKELASGSDPNCPAGQDCFVAAQPLVESPPIEIPTQPVSTPTGSVAQDLRASLRAAGLEGEVLDNLSDAELLSVYEEVMGPLPTASGSLSSDSLTPEDLLLGDPNDYLKNISSGELRELLTQSGISSEFLEGIDDATLKRMFLESL